MNNQATLLLTSLENFYTKENLNILKNNKIPFRILDWFSTNYCKKYDIFIDEINIYISYKTELKAFNKKLFDPFCRNYSINFKGIETSIGQLNFFRWAINTNILKYVELNITNIREDIYIRKNATYKPLNKDNTAKFIKNQGSFYPLVF